MLSQRYVSSSTSTGVAKYILNSKSIYFRRLLSNFVLYTDGGSRGNPGVSGIGCFLVVPLEKQSHLQAESISLKRLLNGKHTSNQSEYIGLINGLQLAHKFGVADIEVRMDSQLVVRQITGEFSVKSPALQELHLEATKLTKLFDTFKISHIDRDLNKEADKLANEAMDQDSLDYQIQFKYL